MVLQGSPVVSSGVLWSLAVSDSLQRCPVVSDGLQWSLMLFSAIVQSPVVSKGLLWVLWGCQAEDGIPSHLLPRAQGRGDAPVRRGRVGVEGKAHLWLDSG